eukprot:768668-Hanusia_phi.AAC.1
MPHPTQSRSHTACSSTQTPRFLSSILLFALSLLPHLSARLRVSRPSVHPPFPRTVASCPVLECEEGERLGGGGGRERAKE